MPSIGKSKIQHYSDSNVAMHDKLVRRFMLSDRDEDVDMMIKLASSIGYMQQTQAALHKNIYSEQDLKEINRKLDRIPPEILQQHLSPTVIEPIEGK